MSTIRDLIAKSLLEIGVLAEGEAPSAAQAASALGLLNDLVDSWSLDNLFLYASFIEDFPLVVGQASYTIGPTGNFNTVRPLEYQGAAMIDGTSEFPIEIIGLDRWRQIQIKSTQSTFPTRLFVDETFPLSTLYPWPVPSAVKSIRLYTLKQITGFATINDTLTLPPGYAKLLRTGLALELCPGYGKSPPAATAAGFLESRAKVKTKNIKPVLMTTDLAIQGSRRFNIYNGE